MTQDQDPLRHPQDDVPTQPDNDPRGPVEYLRVVVDKQLMPHVDLDRDEPAGRGTEQSWLFVEEVFSGPDEPRRVRLRLQHPDSSVSDISPAHTLRTFDAYLRGLVKGECGEIDIVADHIDDTEADDA